MALRRLEQKQVALLRMLAYVLGVRPDEFGLVPDHQGWVPIKELLKALHDEEGWRHLRESMVLEAAQRLDPEGFEVQGKLLRCLSRRPPQPAPISDLPAHLYYGARRRAYPVIRERGLLAGEQGPLVLVADQGQALKLGRRRDQEPVLVTVQARHAQEQGVVFSLLGESLYLCDWVPPDCLMGPPVKEDLLPVKKPAKKKPAEPAAPSPETMAGSFLLNLDEQEKPYKKKGLKKEIKWKDERRKDRRRKD